MEDGRVEVTAPDARGGHVQLDTLGPGDVFGSPGSARGSCSTRWPQPGGCRRAAASSERDRIRTDLDYQVNVKAPVEIVGIAERLARIEQALSSRARPRGPTAPS